MEKWFDIRTPFKVTSKIDVADDGTVTATASPVGIYDPLGILPLKFYEHENVATAKCHPDDEYNRDYGVRLAGNRARMKCYMHAANHINAKLEQLDRYLQIIHEKILRLQEESSNLLVEQMDIHVLEDIPEED